MVSTQKGGVLVDGNSNICILQYHKTNSTMGLLNSMINILGKTVAQGVGSVVEKAVSEAVKPAATKFAQKQADLIESVTKDIDYARKAVEEIEKIEVDAAPTDEEVMARWDELLSDYPKWTCGGNGFSLEEDDLGDGSGKCVRFYLNAIEANYVAYRAVLAANGFRMKYRSDTATWYKEVDGRYPAVHLFHVDDDACEMELVFYMETRDEILEAARL